MNLKLKTQLLARPWLMQPQAMQIIADGINRSEGISDLVLDDFYSSRPEANVEHGVATIYITGALVDHTEKAWETLGFETSYATLAEEIDRVISQGAKAILFKANSGGGMVTGCIELAEKIAGLDIPTATFAEGLACSACYKLIAGTDVIFSSKSASIGNIGAVMTLSNTTAAYEAMGVSFDMFTNEGADLKGTGFANLSDSQREFLQGEINQIGEIFQRHVADNRDIDEEVFRAGWYSGDAALELGLCDVIGGEQDAIDYLTKEITVEN